MRSWWTATALVALLALSGCAKPAPAADPQDVPVEAGSELGGIDGVVVDPAIRPIIEANVTLTGQEGVAATDATGAFAFRDLAPASYLLQVEAGGFLPAQLPVEVAAGQATRVRITLIAQERTEPFPLTQEFQGFVQASAGVLTPVFDRAAEPAGIESCSKCSFQVSPDPGLSRMVLEAAWEDSVPDPAGATEYIWSVTADQTGHVAQGSGTSPIFRVLSALDFGGGGQDAPEFDFSVSPTYTVRIYPDAGWPAASQSYDAFLTMWYRGPPPADWRIIQP